MALPVKFGGGGSFSAYMERRRLGVAAHYERKYGGDCDDVALPSRAEDGLHGQPIMGADSSLASLDPGGVIFEDALMGVTSLHDEPINGGRGNHVGGEFNGLGDGTLYCDAIAAGAREAQIPAGPRSTVGTFFRGCHFYIDGVVRPYAPFLEREPCDNAALHAHETLVKLIVRHGGQVEIHLSEYVTHYVVEHVALGCNKWWDMRRRGGGCGSYFVVTPAFVFECYLMGRRLAEGEFLPDALRKKRNTLSLTQLWGRSGRAEGESERQASGESGGTKGVGDVCNSYNHQLERTVVAGISKGGGESHSAASAVDPHSNENGGSRELEDVVDLKASKEGGHIGCVDRADESDVQVGVAAETGGMVSEQVQVSELVGAIEDVRGCVHDHVNAVSEPRVIGDTSLKTSSDAVLPSATVAREASPSGSETKEGSEGMVPDVGNTLAVEEYYKRSRLHLLGTWKTTVEREFEFEPFCTLNEGMLLDGRILHIDMDAFFVSVALRDKPHLKKHPLAISHGSGRNSASEIATCNYEARKFGVRKGMWVAEALRLCPSLKFVRYDFDAITKTAMQILKIVAEMTKRVYSASCDELYVECFMGAEGSDMSGYLNFAQNLAQAIEKETGCPLSIGIGGNMMLAKLASQRCKAFKHKGEEPPNGCLWQGSVCAVVDVDTFMASVALHEFPGVGDRAMELLRSCGYAYCRDVHDKQELQILLGDKLGNTVFQFCSGRDFRNINTAEKRSQILKNKTISAAINYGVRVKNVEQVYEYMRQLVKQTWERVEVAAGHVLGPINASTTLEVPQAQITLKVRVRSPEASVEPAKYMGCGLCDEFTASVAGDLLSQKSVFGSLVACWNKLMAKQPFTLEDLRGISLGICRIKRGAGEGGNTIDRFLVPVASPTSSAATYPFYRDTPSVLRTPTRTASSVARSVTPNCQSVNKDSILRYMHVSPQVMRTPTKLKRSRRPSAKQLTLCEVVSEAAPVRPGVWEDCADSTSASGSSVVAEAAEGHGGQALGGKLDGALVRDILKIVPSLSRVWVVTASSKIIEKRLRAIRRVWPMYKGVVAFYREIFANYVTLVEGGREVLGALGQDAIEHDGSNRCRGDFTVERNTNEWRGIINEYSETDSVSISHGEVDVPDSGFERLDPTHHKTSHLTTCDNDKGLVTPFKMRRICRSCRTRFFKSFDISMISDLHCNTETCSLPLLRDVEQQEARFDCTKHALTIVVSMLVYTTLVRVAVELSKKRRLDVLQVFVEASIRGAKCFTVPFAGRLHRPLQLLFFTEAYSHLCKVYNLGRPYRV
ncbi:DNA repair protein REV1 isoform X2 [Babesia caballi]|uniref:DNA repair protein REV1 isoform X2 n=1 Tax=Babesia caballi TaxID=5871 RepID=A0AAV4LUD5_BABCB|nr:DNA repair protein REV1 isoform X2 [Babesia caballi]